MAITLTYNQWVSILKGNETFRQEDLRIFQTIYSFNNHAAAATQVAKILGYGNKIIVIGHITQLAKRIIKAYGIIPYKRGETSNKYWPMFFTGWYEGPFFIWKLKPNLQKAMENLSLPLKFNFSEELLLDGESKHFEGLQKKIIVNAYERNPIARQACIDYYGTTCAVCSMDFEEVYGKIGHGYIHVHHLVLISSIGKEYEVDPVKDLRPVCPNCHAMLHRGETTLTIEELRVHLKNRS